MENIHIRNAEPSDYQPIISVINEWWGGRTMCDMLPKLFFVHFRQTCFVAECDGTLVGFLTGFRSQTFPEEAYIHFVGVHPAFRGQGVARTLYERFFTVVHGLGSKLVRCVTSPVNKGSVAFHQRMGFTMELSERTAEGLCVTRNYDGCGEDRVLFVKPLEV